LKKLSAGLIFSYIFLSSIVIYAQSGPLIPEYFRSPVDYSYRLSGNFCELRESHFHAGIDIKPSTSGSKNKIYSIGDGYISRIRVSAGGYGRAIYIDHPDVGYTSVYAHMDIFDVNIENQVKQYQRSQESFEVDFLPEPHVFPVKKGDVIGIMGNTGFSFGKHLHFEIRDTKTENPVNPFLFGMSVTDHTSPSVLSLAVHGIDDDFNKVSDFRLPVGTAEMGVVQVEQPISVPAAKAGIALQAYDKSDGVHNKLGIYGFHLYVDDSLTYSYHMDKVSFDQSRQIIGFYDYETKKRENKTYALCYKYPGNDLEFLGKTGSGIINIPTDKDRSVRMEIEDFRRNKKTIKFLLRRSENTTVAEIKPFRQQVITGDEITINEKNLYIHFKKNSLFRNLRFNLATTAAEGKETLYHIHHNAEPIKSPIEIGIKPERPISGKMDKAIIILNNGNRRRVNYGGKWKDEFLTAKIREFGTFSVGYDTIAPNIRSIDFISKVGKKGSFRFKMGDNMSVRGEDVEQLSYKVWINDIFTISPYSTKTGILEVPIGDVKSGNHLLRIEARDHSDNVSIFSAKFLKK
jgi:Peptidase family M23